MCVFTDLFRNYFRQLREEVCTRIMERVFDADGNPNKHWMQFAKRKFMNIAST